MPPRQKSKHLLLFCWKAFKQDTETLPVSWTLFIWPCDLCCLKKGISSKTDFLFLFSLLNPLTTPLVYSGDNHALNFGATVSIMLCEMFPMDSVSYTVGLSMSFVVLLVKFTLAICLVLAITWVLAITLKMWCCQASVIYDIWIVVFQTFNTNRDFTIINVCLCVQMSPNYSSRWKSWKFSWTLCHCHCCNLRMINTAKPHLLTSCCSQYASVHLSLSAAAKWPCCNYDVVEIFIPEIILLT